MPARKQLALAEERHSIRLIQQVAAGTAGAFVDPITGFSFLATRQGLNGKGGWVSIENRPMLNDASEYTLTLTAQGSDGKDHADRFYALAGSVDPTNPTGPRAPYFPGDEWIEVYRGDSELIAIGTPTDPTFKLDSLTLDTRDVLHPLKKTRETSAGFWCHAPRDVFEHQTRLWLPVVADDFPDSTTQFPGSIGSGGTPNGRWTYTQAYATAPGTVLLAVSPTTGTTASIRSTVGVSDGGVGDHGCWRVEARISAANQYVGVITLDLVAVGTPVITLAIAPSVGFTLCSTVAGGVTTSWPMNTTGLFSASGVISTPITLTIEARDRWIFFYINGQLVSVAPRNVTGTLLPRVSLQNAAPVNLALVTLDSLVLRKTSAPLNGGDPGDYFLPSAPAAGGLAGEYYDTAAAVSGLGGTAQVAGLVSAPLDVTGTIAKIGERVDTLGGLPTGAPTWQYDGLIGSFFVRWTGAIYLPLGTQDVVFAMPSPAGTSDNMRLFVGKTRGGEQILTNWPGDTGISTSVGMRSLFGSVSGWYPIRFEYAWTALGTSNANFTYNVGGAGTVPPSSVLAPLGIHRTKSNAGDSHYDTLKTLVESYGYQWKSQPKQLESGWFPGAVVPRARVGRDTDYVLTIEEAIDPTLTINAEDVANSLLAAGSGLGGSAAGALTLEAFNYAGLPQHPFISQEYENLPATTVPAQLVSQLLSLLGYRVSPWEDVQASTPGARQMQDTYLPIGLLSEFDWAPGDGLRVKCREISIEDVIPRQILSLRRMLYQDGVGENQPSFRPRNRTFEQTLRKFVRQVYGERRTFQGQLMVTPGSRAVAPAYSEAVLPADLSLVRQAQLVVLSKADTTTAFDIEVNGAVPAALAGAVKIPGVYNLGPYLARNGGTEPRMVVRLVNGSTGCQVSYQIRLRELVPSL